MGLILEPPRLTREPYIKPVPINIRTRDVNAAFVMVSMKVSNKVRLLNPASKGLGDYTIKAKKSTYKRIKGCF